MRRTDTGIEALHEAGKDPGLPDEGSGAGSIGRMYLITGRMRREQISGESDKTVCGTDRAGWQC